MNNRGENMDIFVSENVDLSGDGSFEKPFKTLNEAKDYIKNIDNENITVNIVGGRYFFDDTIVFTDSDKKCVYKAYNGEEVIFDGGIVIDNKAAKKISDDNIKSRIIEEKAKNEIYEVDLSKYDIELSEYQNRGFRRMAKPANNEVFINTQPQRVARYPKKGHIPIEKVIVSGNNIIDDHDYDFKKPVIGYYLERSDKWVNAKHAYIDGFLSNGYSEDTIKIEKIDSAKRTITLEIPSMFDVKSGGECRWRVLNLLEEISEPGEYYVDIDAKKLYFYPSEKIEDAIIQLSVLETPFLSFENASNIKVQGITFENARGMGVYIGEGENICIEDCVFRNLGMHAVQIGKGTSKVDDDKNYGHGEYANGFEPVPKHRVTGDFENYVYKYTAWNCDAGKNHLVTGCDIYNLGGGGIILGGGDRKKLIPANNKVHNCHIRRVNRVSMWGKEAVNIMGVGNVVSHCDIEELDAGAIKIHGNDHIIEYNKIHNVLRNSSDGGAIYLGRDPSEVGNVIRYNFIYNIKNPHSYDLYGFCAIYFDDGAIYNEVHGNYFYDIVQRGPFFFSTVHWNDGGETSVSNNVFIDCYPGPDLNTYDNSYDRMHNKEPYRTRVLTKDENDLRGVDVTCDIWREKYPYLYDAYVNDYVHGIKNYNNFVCSGQYQNFEDENPSNLNFKFTKESYMQHKYARITDRVKGYNGEKIFFKFIDFDKIGLIK